VLASCSHQAGARQLAPAASQGDEAAPNEPDELSDGQVVHVLNVLDSSQIAHARIALRRASEPRVRALAQRVLTNHEETKRENIRLSRDDDRVPQRSALSVQMQADGTKLLDVLERSAVARVDATYLKAEIDRHKALVHIVQDQLLPAAGDTALGERLKTELLILQDEQAQAEQLYSVLSPVLQPPQLQP
jgi:predicted outer membrane protein